MIDEVNKLVKQYLGWVNDRTVLKQIDGYVEVTTPYVDRHNDYMQIYIKKASDGYLLTDDAYTISDLELSGCKLETPKRKQLLQVTLNGFGVKQDGKALIVKATEETFALKKHNLLQAMLAVNDLFYLAASTTKSLFLEDVMGWLDEKEIRYTQQVKFTGKSGYDHHFDFVIPKSKEKPERLLSAINRPTKNTAEMMVFAWVDTKDARRDESTAYAILNDDEVKPDPSVIDALTNYEVRPLVWSKRNSHLNELIN